MELQVGQRVTVDNLPGIVSAIHPNGFGVYQGVMHAYVWVRIPSLDYTEINGRTVQNGRAVPFNDVQRRIKP